MKLLIAILVLLLADSAVAQSNLPTFLQGAWKMEGKEIYEHWDLLNENVMKGFSYAIKDGDMVVMEYLEMYRKDDGVYLSASVMNQNDGKPVSFKLTHTDSAFVFENPNHDFPKKIVYKKLNEAAIFVHVSDGSQKSFSYTMEKQDFTSRVKDSSVNPEYDAALAKQLGADDYGMKSFFFVMLKTGSNKKDDKEFINEAFKGHLANINRLVEEKKMIVAGPFGKNENGYRGIFILDNVESFEAAKELLQTDPAIKAGLLDFELYEWYGSAALPLYLPFAEKVSKIKF